MSSKPTIPTNIAARALEVARAGKTLAEPRDLQGRPVRVGRRPSALAAGAIELMGKRPDLRTHGYGVDVFPVSIAEGIDTAILWNA